MAKMPENRALNCADKVLHAFPDTEDHAASVRDYYGSMGVTIAPENVDLIVRYMDLIVRYGD